MSSNPKAPYLHTTLALAVAAALGPVSRESGAQSLEETVVTARRRTQDVQDVPLYIQTMDEKELRESMAKGFEDYARDLTSVAFGTAGPGATTIVFRGAVSQPSGFDQISSSTLYLDEIPITRDGQNPDVRLYDIERLEALSGPQPTLYGAGSQSGTLKIVTNKPDTESNSGSIMVEGGYIEEGDPSYNVSGVANITLIPDELAVRIVGFHEEEGGYIDNVLGNTQFYSPESGSAYYVPGSVDRDNADRVEDDVNDWTVQGARVYFRWQPNENWTIDAGIIYQDTENGQFDFNPALGDLNTLKFKEEGRKDEWYNLSLIIQGDLGFADLTIAGGTHERKIDYDLDSTAYMTQYRDNALGIAEYYTGIREFLDYYTCYYTAGCYNFVSAYDFGANPTARISLNQEISSFAQEIRLVSKDDGSNKFNWLVGAFYEDNNNDWDYISTVDDFAENGGQGAVFTYYGVEPTNDWFDQGFRPELTYNGLPGGQLNGQQQDTDTFAVFAELSYRITDNIQVSGGGRWFDIDRRVTENSLYVGAPFDAFDVTENTKDFTPRFNITWTPTDDILLYATYSEGMRLGGPNGAVTQRPAAGALGLPNAFGPDLLKNHEIGAKATWMDGRVLTNATFFVMDWEDYQLLTSVPIAGNATLNSGNASIDGFEGSFAFKATDYLEFSVAATYLDATIDQDVTFADGAVVAAVAGDKLPAVPEWKVFASLQYSEPLAFWPGMNGTARFDYNFVDESVNGTSASVALFGASTAPISVQPSYEIGSLYFTVEPDQGNWQVWLGIDNLWDERPLTFIAPRFGDERAFTIRPREVSLGIWYGF
ncbi:MAG: TonB-dependent receptor [Pseudomonadota bacterium]